MGIRRHYLALAMLVAALGLVVTLASAQSAPETRVLDQWQTSVQHSKFSQQYDAMQTAKQHLQHVVNCVEGQRGPLYDGGAGNPCEGKGSGLITDAKTAGGKYAKAVPWFETADDIAASGIKAKSVAKVKTAAWVTQMVLERAGQDLKN